MFQLSSLRAVGAALLACACAAPVQAQVYKCPQANGSIGFQATPCTGAAAPAPHPTAAQLNAQRVKAPVDDKPYDDPYAGSMASRPHPVAPQILLPAPSGTPGSAHGARDLPPASGTSDLVADVQARNRAETNHRAAVDEFKRTDKTWRATNCAIARNNAKLLNSGVPVGYRDKNGKWIPLQDKDRKPTMSRAEEVSGTTCY